VERQSGPLLPVFRELKRIFDPSGILNPGKIVGPDPSRPAWPLRPVTNPLTCVVARVAEKTARIPLLATDPGVQAAACNGCGDCRVRTGPVRMCPVFREAASPRAKANLARLLLSPDPADPPRPEDVRAVADLCVNCKMCRSECRAGVDVPRLMLAAKAADHADRGLDRNDWVLARAEALAALGGTFPSAANLLLGNRPARWLIEKLFGLSRHRTLPRFTHRTFLRRAKRAGLTHLSNVVKSSSLHVAEADPGLDDVRRDDLTTTKVAYFVDTFANYTDPLTAEATVAVLRRNGFEVHVPPRQRGSGVPPLVAGDVDTAREIAARNVRVLAELVRDGYTVVCSEPTAAVALTQDYLDLLSDPDARLVAANTVELTAFLGALHAAGRLDTNFQRLDVTLGHHVPCHVKALGGPPAGPGLLELIPGVRVRTIDVSCSGMAGTWGLRADHYDTSLAAGRPMLDELNRPGVLFGSSECGTCRMQMQEGTGKRALHPVQFLALAYGLVPEIEARLFRRVGKRVD
jgi:Fe-S oxidoreductase